MSAERDFLAEYGELCRRYGVVVDSCGCCKSPWLTESSAGGVEEHLAHLAADLPKEEVK